MATTTQQEREKTASETVAESVSGEGSSIGEDLEMRIAMPGDRSAAESDADTASVDEDLEAEVEVDADTDATAAAATERAATKCAQCSSRKAKSCVNNACKRCCVRIGSECAVHTKPPVDPTASAGEAVAVQLRKTRKPVLKNEFKESNIMYYEETVTLFCLRDFFQAKKLSQPLLNDQTRALRVTGASAVASTSKTVQKKRRVADAELKKRVMGAVWGDAKRRKMPVQ